MKSLKEFCQRNEDYIFVAAVCGVLFYIVATSDDLQIILYAFVLMLIPFILVLVFLKWIKHKSNKGKKQERFYNVK